MWDCREYNSYRIVGKSHTNSKNDLKKYPSSFIEVEDKELKTFSVSYDFKKKTGFINGSPLMVIVGDLEAEGEAESSTETTKNANGEIIEKKNFFYSKNRFVPITFFSSESYLEEQNKLETSFSNKGIMEKKENIIIEKKYFTIEDASSSSSFSILSVSSHDDYISTIDSENNEFGILDYKEVIDLSTGYCDFLGVKG